MFKQAAPRDRDSRSLQSRVRAVGLNGPTSRLASRAAKHRLGLRAIVRVSRKDTSPRPRLY